MGRWQQEHCACLQEKPVQAWSPKQKERVLEPLCDKSTAAARDAIRNIKACAVYASIWCAVASIFCTAKGSTDPLQMMAQLLTVYIYMRENRRRHCVGMQPHKVPGALAHLTTCRNPVAELVSGRDEVSLTSAFEDVQLHNVLSEHDPWEVNARIGFEKMVGHAQAGLGEAANHLDTKYLRTCMLVFRGAISRLAAVF